MRFALIIFLLMTTALRAEPLRIVTTIPPLFGLTSDLMRGIGEPELIIDSGVDLHHFSLRPSQISALNNADVIFAVGAEMEPWLEAIQPQLTAEIVFLAELSATDDRLPMRELTEFGDKDAHDDHEGHGHENDFDPHMWLDPVLGRIWLNQISLALSIADPANAALYAANAQEMIANSEAADSQLNTIASLLRDTQLIVTHDSLQYLEKRFDLNIVGALSDAMDISAGPRTLAGLMDIEGDICILVDTNEDSHDPQVLFPDLPVANFDPLGHALAGKPNYLGNLTLSIASSLENCLTTP